MYDTVNQIKSPFTTHVAPNTSTNLTMSFNNPLNTVHHQVSSVLSLNGNQREVIDLSKLGFVFSSNSGFKLKSVQFLIGNCTGTI